MLSTIAEANAEAGSTRDKTLKALDRSARIPKVGDDRDIRRENTR